MDNVEKECIKAAAELGKDIAEDIVRPTSKSIGENLGLLVDGVMGWLGYWGEKQKIKRQVYLKDYKNKITKKVLNVPEENITEPSIRIVGPAIEASKFFIEEEYCREMFANLIASACDDSKKNIVHPSFPDIIKQITPLDAKLLALFEDDYSFAVSGLIAKYENNKVTPFAYLLFDLKTKNDMFSEEEQINLTKTIENLRRCGLLELNRDILELNYDYERFRNHWMYNMFDESIYGDCKIEIIKYRIELTVFGNEFLKCCVDSE